MDTYQCLKERRTVRSFKPDPVPETVVKKILEVARWAPSSRDQQPWHLVVIRDRDTLLSIGGIAGTGRFIAEAPMAIALIMENADQPRLDAGRALQQMEIMAWAEGMGTCFVTLTADQEKRVKELLEIPSSLALVTVLPFGYRPGDFKARGRLRRPLGEMVHEERFGNRIA